MLRGLKQFNLPEIEEKVLQFWKESQIFEKTLNARKKAKPFRFYEGPPTANGRPGLHHVLARAFKDIVCRYKTMRGYFVSRRAGWDTHGLPVEIEVEKKLGLKNKQEIEKFGIAEFNTQAKMSVWTYKTEWEKLTERIGFWLDFENPYITYDNNYIESAWWVFAEIAKRGLLNKLHKIVPWCPRCQTPLSNHELGQPGAYKLTKDPSVYVKFRIGGGKEKKKGNEYLLVWTTTPWTLPANVAVAVNPQLTYTKYKVGDDFYWSYNAPPTPSVANETRRSEMEVVEKISGKKLVGIKYEALYANEGAHEVIAGDFVSTEEGTGLVHIAPAYGEDDLRVAGKGPIPVTIDDAGIMAKGLPGAGRFIKQADDDIMADLEKRGLLYHKGTIEHDYPFCWRCGTPLIYFARKSWFIEISKLNKEMLAANQKINWIPEHIKDGRFGEWLKDPKDWSIARNRYWGTPLPIWECEKNNAHRTFAGSLADLNTHAYSRNRYFIARHCEGDHNISGILASGPEKNGNGARLTEKGRLQAEKMAVTLKKQGIDLICASPFKRTQETAKIIAKLTGAPVKNDKRLGEMNFGVLNDVPVQRLSDFTKTHPDRFTEAPTGGETLTDVKKRMMEFWREIDSAQTGKNILIVSHGDPIWMMMGAMAGKTNEEILNGKGSYLKTGEFVESGFNNWPFNKEGELDIHRPFIDEVILKCAECGAKMRRIKEVADVWFDSGAMPYAQWHYPFENKKLIDSGAQFPADYIAEGMDQTRGWFYTLLAVSTLLSRGLAYRNVISFGLLLDKNGQKMSKSKGNVVDPWEMVKKYGADTVRWYFYTVNPPGEFKKFDELDLGKTLRKIFMLAYNSYAFYQLNSDSKDQPIKILDRWIWARTHQTIEQATANLEKYEIGGAAKLIEELVDDLSRWYIRRSRKNVSPKTLRLVLEEIAKLMAPFAPFFGEALYKSVGKKASVHLENWPKADKKKIDKKLLEAMAEVRRLASIGLSEREKAGIKVRQPLARLKVKGKRLKGYDKELLEILKDEVNVKEVVFDNKITGEMELDTVITPELKTEGLLRDLSRAIQGLRHDAKYQPKDKIILMLELPAELLKTIEAHETTLKVMVNAKQVVYKREKFDAELETRLDDQPVWIAVKKA